MTTIKPTSSVRSAHCKDRDLSPHERRLIDSALKLDDELDQLLAIINDLESFQRRPQSEQIALHRQCRFMKSRMRALSQSIGDLRHTRAGCRDPWNDDRIFNFTAPFRFSKSIMFIAVVVALIVSVLALHA